MAKTLKITILTHPQSWMNVYDLKLKKLLLDQLHQVQIISNKNEITKGDILFLLSCEELISAKKLSENSHNIVVHASKLPQGRGWSPASWQILEGKNDIPLTLFEAMTDVDSGPIFIQDKINLDGSELIDEWQEKMGNKIVSMCLDFVENYEFYCENKKEQSGEVSFYERRTPRNSMLDLNKSLKEQFNLLRIVDNEKYPAYFEMNGQKYILQIKKER